MYGTWNVTVRDAAGGVRAEFAITATTPAQVLRESARHLVAYPQARKVEFVLTHGPTGEAVA
jgi:hypothetical protein